MAQQVYKQVQVLSVLTSHIFNDRINEKDRKRKKRERKEKVKEVNKGMKEGRSPY